jgi:hypothetical protein
MDDTTILGGALNQLGQAAKKVGQQMAKLPIDMSKDLGKQIAGGKPVTPVESSISLRDEESDESKQNQKQGWKSDEERIQFLKGLYGKTDTSKNVNQTDKSAPFAKASVVKPEEQKKLIELRNQLHKENYYDPTFNPSKKQEERPAEKVENEKKQEMMELQQKDAKKPPPLAVVREQNKAEMFRGAAG